MSLLHRKFFSSVISINIMNSENNALFTVGSGFLVNYHNQIYAVTNRHVLEPLTNYFLSLPNSSLLNERYIYIKIDNAHFFKKKFHSTQDIAVIHIPRSELRQMEFDAIPIEETALKVDQMKQLQIYEGNEVYLLGHPLNLTADNRLYPLCRYGMISQITPMYDRPINEKSYWIDSLSFPGNSGGPVFLKPEHIAYINQTAVKETFLIGVINAIIMKKKAHGPALHSGLSNVIPMDYVLETLISIRKEISYV